MLLVFLCRSIWIVVHNFATSVRHSCLTWLCRHTQMRSYGGSKALYIGNLFNTYLKYLVLHSVVVRMWSSYCFAVCTERIDYWAEFMSLSYSNLPLKETCIELYVGQTLRGAESEKKIGHLSIWPTRIRKFWTGLAIWPTRLDLHANGSIKKNCCLHPILCLFVSGFELNFELRVLSWT